MRMENNKTCTRGLWNSSVPGIIFDENGVSNYAVMFDSLVNEYPRGKEGLAAWENWVSKMKSAGIKKKYDCLIGVSGGTDSCYLLHLAKQYGLRPLAVNLDNGWNSSVAIKNVKKVTDALNIDLETYIIDYGEVKKVLRSYLKASLPWIDSPTDLAIKATLYNIAIRNNIKFILNGSDFRSEGKQPTEWTYSDAKQLKYLVHRFENFKLSTFPYYSMAKLIYYGFFRNIKMLRPFYYVDYNKRDAQELLKNTYGWEYYGGHHYENLFTKFVISYWLPVKFGIDKRIITLSAQVMSGELDRSEALQTLKQLPYDIDQIEKDKEYVLKKLDLDQEEFKTIWNSPNRFYYDYPSYMPLFNKLNKYVVRIFKYILPFKPGIFIELKARENITK